MTTRFTLTVLGLATATACSFRDASELSDVLPDDRLEISLPEDETESARDSRDWSEAYLLTRGVTDDVNGMVGSVLLWARLITLDTPKEKTDEMAVWGPYGDTLDPYTYTLTIEKEASGDYSWRFDFLPKGIDDAEWITVVDGWVEAGATKQDSHGGFTIDFDEVAYLDPNSPDAAGLFEVEYELTTDGVWGIVDYVVDNDAGEEVTITYQYEQSTDGDGSMDLVADADADEDGDLDRWSVRSRWASTGAGRSDARLDDGDGTELGTLNECWSESFETAWRYQDWDGAEEGDAASCAFEDASYSEL